MIVVGGGAAGLAAARAIDQAGVSVALLEARDRLGGRIFTHRDTATPVPIELGAEFIHGRAPDINRLLRGASLSSVDVGGQRWTARRGQFRELHDFWERLERVMGRLSQQPGRDRSFRAFLKSRPGGQRLARDRTLAREFVEGFHAADIDLISAQALAEGGSPGEDIRERRLGRIIDGYDRVIDCLATPLARHVHTSTIVTSVRWRPGKVIVHADHPDGQARTPIEARAIVIAVPLGVLKAEPGMPGTIAFVPELPQKQRALARLAVGHVMRVTLRLHERFWASEWFAKRAHTDQLDTLSFLHTPDEDFPVWWTSYPTCAPIMTGWRGGPPACRLSKLAPEEIEARAVASLGRQTGIPPRQMRSMVEGAWTHDWEHDPFARGAYSYQVVGGTGAPAALARPIQGTLFFAGEATDTEGGTGTVDGAIATGRRAAAQVMRASARAGARRPKRT